MQSFFRRRHRLNGAFGPLWRAWCWRMLLGVPVVRVGYHANFRGYTYFQFSSNLRVGEFCWIEAESSNGGDLHEPGRKLEQYGSTRPGLTAVLRLIHPKSLQWKTTAADYFSWNLEHP